jgi:hypothetical protein
MKGAARVMAVLFLLAPAALVAAGGAGGVGFGGQYFDPSLSSADIGMSTMTGFGYGSGSDGSRVGGFGAAFFSAAGDVGGGVGGMIVGHEWNAGPVTVALTLWGGLGGASWGTHGYMLALGAAQAELGVWVLPWMQIVGYVGYEALGNVLPGFPFNRALLNTPVLGLRIAWGSP